MDKKLLIVEDDLLVSVLMSTDLKKGYHLSHPFSMIEFAARSLLNVFISFKKHDY